MRPITQCLPSTPSPVLSSAFGSAPSSNSMLTRGIGAAALLCRRRRSGGSTRVCQFAGCQSSQPKRPCTKPTVSHRSRIAAAGPVIWENLAYVSPNDLRAAAKRTAAGKYTSKVGKKQVGL